MANKKVLERIEWFDKRVRARQYPSTDTISKHFDICRKTAQRDIDYLRDGLHAPLEYDKSRKGWYYTRENFIMAPIYAHSSEIRSILVARQLLKNIGGEAIKKDMSAILEKIKEYMPKNSTVRNLKPERIDEAISVQMIEFSTVSEEIFSGVLTACIERRSISFTYYSPASGETTSRKVNPLHLFNYMGTWHLLAYCHLREDIRDFVLGRITDFRLLEDNFYSFEGLKCSVKEYMNTAFGIFKGASTTRVVLKFSPMRANWVKEQKWHKEQESLLLQDGSLQLGFPVANFHEVKMEILKYGADVEVLEPQELREIIRDEAAKIAAVYKP